MLDADGFEQTYEAVTLSDATVVGRYYENCVFRRCAFDKVKFIDCRFVDCTFENCDLVGVRLPGCTVSDVVFKGGRAMGVDWGEAQPITLRVVFKEIRIDYSNFGGLPLKRISFTDCSMQEVGLDRADLTQARFVDCDLRGAVLLEAKLRGAKFERCVGLQLDPRKCKLGDTQVGADTALAMLRLLGIVCPELGVT